jgi:hypothetical protein
MAKKTWNKTKNRILVVGVCKYCHKELINTDSFVSFYGGGHAHYQCMKEDYELQKKILDSVEQQLKEEKKFDW